MLCISLVTTVVISHLVLVNLQLLLMLNKNTSGVKIMQGYSESTVIQYSSIFVVIRKCCYIFENKWHKITHPWIYKFILVMQLVLATHKTSIFIYLIQDLSDR